MYADYLIPGLDNVMLIPASAMRVKKHYVLPKPSLIDLVSKKNDFLRKNAIKFLNFGGIRWALFLHTTFYGPY